MKTLFFICPICGNVIHKLSDSGVVPVCCGKPMQVLEPNTVDAAVEKHVPAVYCVDDCLFRVDVGSAPHPMSLDHFIRWIYVETKNGAQLRYLKPSDAPSAYFYCGSDKPLAVYVYCNLHGLWKTTAIRTCPCSSADSMSPDCPMS